MVVGQTVAGAEAEPVAMGEREASAVRVMVEVVEGEVILVM